MCSKSYRAPILSLILALGLVGSTSVRAAVINYGNFNLPADGVSFLQVIESSGTDAVPLFGPPDPFSVGLDFDPVTFVASASGGAADITDGQLNFTAKGLVIQTGGVGIEAIQLFESGDYTLTGVGTAATKAIAAASIHAVVTEVDGVAITPLALSPANASVSFNLVANPGVLQPWSLGLSLNIDGLLTASNIPFTIGATKVEVVIDNQLIATSESGSLSSIAKKDFRVSITPDLEGVIPEPATAGLAGVLLAGLAARRRRH